MPQQRKSDYIFNWQTGIWYIRPGAELCSMPRAMVQLLKEPEQHEDETDIEDFTAFSMKSLDGFAILDG